MTLLRTSDATIVFAIMYSLFASVYWTSALAKRHGRDPRRWAFLGLCLPYLSMLMLWVDIRAKKAADTLAAANSVPRAVTPDPPEPVAVATAAAALPQIGWHVLKDDAVSGPLTLDETRVRVASAADRARVWVAGFKTWTDPRRVPGL
jgi:hypothetical protein